jgi:uncharacterized protein YcaQ
LLREITPDDLSAFTLQRHFAPSGPSQKDIVRVTDRICGLNAQSARAAYVSLWNRIDGFTKDDLAQALYGNKTLIKAWLMRGTVHIVPTAEFPIYQKALRRILCSDWEASLRRQTLLDIPRNWNRLLDAIVKTLAGGPLAKRDLVPRLKGLLRGNTDAEKKRLVGWALRALTYQGVACHDRPTGPWYHFKDNRFALVGDWLDPDRLEGIDEAEARSRLLIKYLTGYGPATIQDFAYWAGLKMPMAREIFGSTADRLGEIRVRGSKTVYWVPKQRLDAVPRRGTHNVAALLPEFDPLIMGHKDKSRILDERYRPDVFLRLADVAPTILFDGRVAGTWSYSFTSGAFLTKPFKKLSPADTNRLNQMSRSLVTFLSR